MDEEIGELSVDQYLSLLEPASRGRPNAFLARCINRHGGRDQAVHDARWFVRLVGKFRDRHGPDRRICLYEAPGRVNLMGMHIDHRGGVVNPVATRQRIRAVCSRRCDDLIQAVSLFGNFGEGQCRLSERLPGRRLDSLGEWLKWTDQQVQATGGGKQFINYFACGPVYAASFIYPPDQPLAGADFVFDSDLPPSAGMSSSSAVVILASDFFLRCNSNGLKELTLDQLLDLYGYGEWYIGTRGGKGDHAAIKISKRGAVCPVITTPEFRALDPLPIQGGFDIVLYSSGDEANKSVEPFKTSYHAPIIAYQAGEILLTDFVRDHNFDAFEKLMQKRSSMDRKHHRVYLGDAINDDLLTESQIYQFLRSVPRRMTQKKIFGRFASQKESFQDGLHVGVEPDGGFGTRDVTAYGFSECSRSKMAAVLLASGNMDGFAAMLNTSQLGDQVLQVEDPLQFQRKFLDEASLDQIESNGMTLDQISGDYHVSTPNVDRLVSLCRSSPGVMAARLSGAGLGGMLTVFGQEGFDEQLDPILQQKYYEPLDKSFNKIRISPSDGAGFY